MIKMKLVCKAQSSFPIFFFFTVAAGRSFHVLQEHTEIAPSFFGYIKTDLKM